MKTVAKHLPVSRRFGSTEISPQSPDNTHNAFDRPANNNCHSMRRTDFVQVLEAGIQLFIRETTYVLRSYRRSSSAADDTQATLNAWTSPLHFLIPWKAHAPSAGFRDTPLFSNVAEQVGISHPLQLMAFCKIWIRQTVWRYWFLETLDKGFLSVQVRLERTNKLLWINVIPF